MPTQIRETFAKNGVRETCSILSIVTRRLFSSTGCPFQTEPIALAPQKELARSYIF